MHLIKFQNLTCKEYVKSNLNQNNNKIMLKAPLQQDSSVRRNLKKSLRFQKKINSLLQKEEKTPYDCIKSNYEPVWRGWKLDQVFTQSKTRIQDISDRLAEKERRPRTDFYLEKWPKEQHAFCDCVWAQIHRTMISKEPT